MVRQEHQTTSTQAEAAQTNGMKGSEVAHTAGLALVVGMA